MYEPEFMSKFECRQCLFDDLRDLAVIQTSAAMLRQFRRIHTADKFGDEVNNAVMRAVFDVTDDVRVLQRCRDLYLSHESF